MWATHRSTGSQGTNIFERSASGATGVITVVSGLPRSGTSLMMQMLLGAGLRVLTDGAREADEDNPRGYFEYAPVRALRRDASWLGDARGHVVKIVAPLLSDLPEEHDYRVVWMNRDLKEVLASQQRMLERRGDGDPRGNPAALSHAFEAQLKKVRAELKRRRVPVFDVAYARAVAEPSQVASEVCHFLGGDLDAKSAASAVDSALYRQRATTA